MTAIFNSILGVFPMSMTTIILVKVQKGVIWLLFEFNNVTVSLPQTFFKGDGGTPSRHLRLPVPSTLEEAQCTSHKSCT